jgi:flagellar biosynthesis protein FlhA
MGIVIPPVHIQDNMQLKPVEYTIMLKGNEVARGELMINHYLAMKPGNGKDKLEGVATKEPTYGLPALWIKEKEKERALSKGYTVVDLPTVLITHLSEIIRKYSHELLGRQEVQNLIDSVKETHPKVIEELIPNTLSIGNVGKVLQNLLKEQIPIRDLPTILETMADWAPVVKDLESLTEYVRQALSRTISKLYMTDDGYIPVITLDNSVEEAISTAIKETDRGSYLAIDPSVAERIMNSITAKLDKLNSMNYQPVVMCSSHIRSHFKKLTDRFIPNLITLSYNDIISNAKIKSLGTVEL